MKKNLAASFLRLSVLLSTALFASNATADFYLHHWESHRQDDGKLLIKPVFTYYFSGENFSIRSKTFSPAELDRLTRIGFDVDIQYGLFERLSAYARISWARLGVTRITSGGKSNGSTFGFADQTLGLNYRLYDFSGPWIEVQVQADIPAYDNKQSITDNTPFMGDHSFDLTGGAFLKVPIGGTASSKLILLSAGGGFTYRTSDFSYHLPFRAAMEYTPGGSKGFVFSTSMQGIFSLQNDGLPTRSSTGAVAGGSFWVNAVEPSLLSVQGEAGYQISSKIGFGILGNVALAGTSAPHGFFFGAQAKFSFGGGEPVEAESVEAPGERFQVYELEGQIVKVNDRLALLQINKGKLDGVLEGQAFDVFSLDKKRQIKEVIARAVVTSVRDHESILKIQEYYKEVWIEEGFPVKRPIR